VPEPEELGFQRAPLCFLGRLSFHQRAR
jgi:hypothetical protein